jgi:hypothetical protein
MRRVSVLPVTREVADLSNSSLISEFSGWVFEVNRLSSVRADFISGKRTLSWCGLSSSGTIASEMTTFRKWPASEMRWIGTQLWSSTTPGSGLPSFRASRSLANRPSV